MTFIVFLARKVLCIKISRRLIRYNPGVFILFLFFFIGCGWLNCYPRRALLIGLLHPEKNRKRFLVSTCRIPIVTRIPDENIHISISRLQLEKAASSILVTLPSGCRDHGRLTDKSHFSLDH